MSRTSTSFRKRVAALAVLAAWALTPLPVLAAPALTNPEIAAWVTTLEGAWAGSDNRTPMGPMPFALVFDREPDGSLHAHTAASRDTWIDLRFHVTETGEWRFTEGGKLQGLGEQWHTMALHSASGDTLVWADVEQPDLLRCRVAVLPEEFSMQVFLRGTEHVVFRLPRVRGEEEVELRRELTAARERDEGELEQIAAPPQGDGIPETVRTARSAAESAPNDAHAHLALGQAIAPVLADAPSNLRPGYAMEMYAALQRAVTLDPTLPEARYALAQYHLRAPAIAGGSLEKAAVDAARLTDLGSPLAEVVQAQIESRRGATDAARARLERLLRDRPDSEAARQALATIPAPGE